LLARKQGWHSGVLHRPTPLGIEGNAYLKPYAIALGMFTANRRASSRVSVLGRYPNSLSVPIVCSGEHQKNFGLEWCSVMSALGGSRPCHLGTFCRIYPFVVYVASFRLLLSGILILELPAGRAEFR
jgi:hypothetical protein